MMQAEQLEQRLTLGAPLALSSAGDLLFADPTADDLLEPAVFADSVKTNPAPPAPYPVLLTAADEGCCSSAVYNVSFGFLSNVDEATPDVPGYLGFSATTCAGNPPTCLTISYSIVGGTATENQDYTGLSSGSVTIPVSFGSGFVQIPWNAVDDQEDEPDEDVLVAITGGSDPNGGSVVLPDPPYARGLVASNDYTVELYVNGKKGTALSLSASAAGLPKSGDVKVKVSKGGVKQASVQVEAGVHDENGCTVTVGSNSEITGADGLTPAFKVTATSSTAPFGTATVKFLADVPGAAADSRPHVELQVNVKP